MTIDALIHESDVKRTIRYIDSIPVDVRNDRSDGTTHDIERYCAFQQSSFQEAEASADPSVGFLAKAREARMAILDSLDKAITVIHLLTNTQWGPDVAQFLSCRQGIPTRDKLVSWGDRMVVSDMKHLSVKRLTESINADLETYHSHKSVIDSLRNLRYIFEVRCTEEGIAAVIELLPSLNRAVDSVYIATVLLSTVGRPQLKLHPLIKTLVDKQFELVVQVNDLDESASAGALVKSGVESVIDELLRCRYAALDYAIISSMHDEVRNGNTLEHGWLVVNTSRYIDSLSLVVVGSSGTEISISLSRPRFSEEVNPHTRYLRNAFLDQCRSVDGDQKALLSRFLGYVRHSDS